MAALERRRVRPCTHILSRGKPDVKPLRLYFRRVVIQSSGQGGPAPRPFRSRDASARRGWSRSARPRPKERAPTKRGRTAAPWAAVRTRGSRSRVARRPTDGALPGPRDTAPRHAPPSPPQRTGGRFARRNFRRACATGTTAERERERQKGRHQRPPPSPAPWRSRHQEPPATAPVPGNVGACQPPPAPAERRRSGEQPRRAEGFARSENLRRSGWQQRRCRQFVYLI